MLYMLCDFDGAVLILLPSSGIPIYKASYVILMARCSMHLLAVRIIICDSEWYLVYIVYQYVLRPMEALTRSVSYIAFCILLFIRCFRHPMNNL